MYKCSHRLICQEFDSRVKDGSYVGTVFQIWLIKVNVHSCDLTSQTETIPYKMRTGLQAKNIHGGWSPVYHKMINESASIIQNLAMKSSFGVVNNKFVINIFAGHVLN